MLKFNIGLLINYSYKFSTEWYVLNFQNGSSLCLFYEVGYLITLYHIVETHCVRED